MADVSGVSLWFNRESECAALQDLVDAVRKGASGTLVVRGEPGIGKTRLLEFAAGLADDFRVERVACVESEMELPLAGLHQLTLGMFALRSRLPEPQQRAMETAFGLAEGPAPDRFFVGLAVLTLLAEAARSQPLLCLIDDAQWLDQESAEILAFVSRRLQADRIGFVFALREPVEDRPWWNGLPELFLGGLPAPDARLLVAAMTSGTVARPLLDRLVADTGGNPLALVELSGDLTDESLTLSPPAPSLAEPLPIGRRLEEAYMRRIRTLPSDTQALLVVAAAESTGDPRLLMDAARTLGIDPGAVEAAEEKRLLLVGSTIAFAHPLMRSAVYHSASARQRRAAHAALAAVSDATLDGDRRAWHRSLSVSTPDEEIAAELERCADRARARGGYAAAATVLARAAEMSVDKNLWSRRLLSAAEAELTAGSPDQAGALLDRVHREFSSEAERGTARRLSGMICLAKGQLAEAASHFLEAARTLMPIDPKLGRATLLRALEAANYHGRALVQDVSAAADALAGQPTENAPTSIVDDLLFGLLDRFAGRHEQAGPLFRRAVERLLTDQVPDDQWPVLFELGALVAIELFDAQGVAAVEEAYVGLARRGAPSALPRALNFFADTLTREGRFAEAEDAYAEAAQIAAAMGSVGVGGSVAVTRVSPLAWRGRESEARATAAEAMAESEVRGLAHGIGMSNVRARLAVLELGLGNYQAALDHARYAFEQELVPTGAYVLPDLVEAAVRCDAREVAQQALDQLAVRAQLVGAPWGLGLLARCRALMADDVAAEPLYQEAVAVLGATRIVTDVARTHLLYGEWLRRRARRREARVHLRTAYDMLADIGAGAFAERARLELEATGERARQRRADTVLELTARELQVARLVGEGYINREVASQLYLSTATIDYHLRKVYAKLGIRSRTQLVQYLSRTERP